MKRTRLLSSLLCSAAFAAFATPAEAGVSVRVTITGEVEFNQVNPGQLGQVNVGETAVMSFLLDSDVFDNSLSFPTRGYVINQDSFQIEFDSTTIGLQSPLPPGAPPFFVLRDNDPAVDGFFIARSTDFPIGVPIAQTGGFGQFINNFSVTYGGSDLSSLDILDALGTYDFTGLTVFNWTIDDGPFNPVGMIFQEMTIELADDPWEDLGGGTVGANGADTLVGTGTLVGGSPTTLDLTGAPANALTLAWLSFSSAPVSALGGTVHATPFSSQFLFNANPAGAVSLAVAWPVGIPSGTEAWFQFFAADPSVIWGITLSNALKITTP